MDGVNKFVKATLIGGLLVVLPIGVVAMLALRFVATQQRSEDGRYVDC
ncbi:MAG: hypothetical protein ACYS9T_11835 [Planctomycetota bacterium]